MFRVCPGPGSGPPKHSAAGPKMVCRKLPPGGTQIPKDPFGPSGAEHMNMNCPGGPRTPLKTIGFERRHQSLCFCGCVSVFWPPCNNNGSERSKKGKTWSAGLIFGAAGAARRVKLNLSMSNVRRHLGSSHCVSSRHIDEGLYRVLRGAMRIFHVAVV